MKSRKEKVDLYIDKEILRRSEKMVQERNISLKKYCEQALTVMVKLEMAPKELGELNDLIWPKLKSMNIDYDQLKRNLVEGGYPKRGMS